MAQHRPRIIVTGPRTRYPTAWWCTRFVLKLLGAEPVHRVPGQSEHLNHRFDGIVIGGGDDIDASLYGAENHELAEFDPERDAFEVALIKEALAENIPMLGICRGAQLINVVLGGSLYGDIRGGRHLTSNRRSLWPSKSVHLNAGTRLARVMQGYHIGRLHYPINSLHHQAIDRLGDGLQVVGRDADGFVQAVENKSAPFLVGVQWHPEYLPYFSAQRRIFKALVTASRSHAG